MEELAGDDRGALPEQNETEPGPALPRQVVGIGASAGGLESLEKLFQSLPADTGMAFVVIQHLSPDFKSMMYELLSRDTRMPIHRAEDGMTIEANHVYLLPPKKEIIIAGGQLHLTDKDPTRGLTLPIDRFLESLATECGPQSVAIILSGSGSDGSRGLREIAEAGGLVLCESPETAKFDGMPLSAHATGMVDHVLPPEAMGPLLAEHAERPLKMPGAAGLALPGPVTNLRGLEAIFELFRREFDIDFSAYKDATILRRVSRRMMVSGASVIDDYARRLREDRTELNALYEDLLIGVTQFFRDDEVFDFLAREALPDLLRRRDPGRTLRVWVAGCGSGEEAYSLAILLHECCEALGRPLNLKIFATDVHRKTLAVAGRGVFSEKSLEGLSIRRRDRYFIRKGELCQVVPELREKIVFASHNVLRDAPFTDLDLVSCRNLLIYFQPAAQTKALSMFHFGLGTDGILLLGSSESPGELASEFEVVDQHCKVYRKWRQARLPAEVPLGPERGLRPAMPTAAIRGFSVRQRNADQGLLGIYDQLLSRYMPPSLLISEQRELIDSFGGAERLLRLQSRRPSLDVLELVDPSIRTTLLGAIQRTIKGQQPVRFSGVRIEGADGPQMFNLTVEPVRNDATHATQYLLTLEPAVTAAAPAAVFEQAPDVASASRDERIHLETELRYTRENLQATIEELETSNEELQATNEELVASNEELQSTNEELHSVNEELYTVNAEHQRKISELAEVNQDLDHLLENTDVATVFLDRDLRIRKFTSRICQIFDLIDQDIGRPIASFAHRIRLDGMVERLVDVRDRGEPFETEVHSSDGVCYLLRILPYRVKSSVEGIVLTLVDLSPLEELRGRLRWMSDIVASTEDAVIGEDLAGHVTSWNAAAEKLFGYRADEVAGRHISFLVPPARRHEIREYLERARAGESVRTLETIRIDSGGKELHIALTVSPVRDALHRVIGVSKIARDVSDRVAVERELRQQADNREKFLALLSHELRNPLGAVVNASRLLDDPRTPADRQSLAIATIRRQAGLIESLLNDLLDVSRIAQGRIELRTRPLDLRELVEPIRETAAHELERHDARLQFELPDEPLPVEGDPARLIQVHVNLIQNAAKYSAPGKPITISMRAEGHEAVIAVRDEGAGIPADFLPRIFEPFVQSDETLHRSEGGLGVGLTLVKTLVELHGGTVTAKSPGRGCGSTFVIRLPLLNAQQFSAQPNADGAWENRAAPGPTPPLRLVVVEDQAENRAMLESLLQLDGHTVASAANGEEGLDLIVRKLPDVALIDVGLPGIDGYEVARRIRQRLNGDRFRLIALTGYGQPSDVERALEAGFDAHLVKPLSPPTLAALLQRLCPAPAAAARQNWG